MKISTSTLTFLFAIAGSASAFTPIQVPARTPTMTVLHMGKNNENSANFESIVDKAGHALEDAEEGLKNVIDRGEQATAHGLNPKEEEDMWQAQRELQENRNKHSTKESRMEKYDEPPVIENDHHDEVRSEWTKKGGDDHYSVNGKL